MCLVVVMVPSKSKNAMRFSQLHLFKLEFGNVFYDEHNPSPHPAHIYNVFLFLLPQCKRLVQLLLVVL